ncbi:MAG: trypsin-like serine protease [Oscillospiraceae bacterium]|nr:trypsin-like serine protease [Oscillospiraceae bacterium]
MLENENNKNQQELNHNNNEVQNPAPAAEVNANQQASDNNANCNSASYSYSQGISPGPAFNSAEQEKPKKKKRIFTKVISFAVCAALISGGSIQCYKYISNNASLDNFFSKSDGINKKSDKNSSEDESSDSLSAQNTKSDAKSWLELAAREDSLSIPDAVSKVMPAVVGISSDFTVKSNNFGYDNWFFGSPGQSNTQTATATGTGIVMTSDGYVITNAHVISDSTYGVASNISVVMSDEKKYDATIIGCDSDTDIAVLKVDATGLATAEFGNSDDLRVGELVIAIGNPLGFELFGSVTCGIVSALNRDITVNDKQMNLIQTDAAINSGNSGGPLINSYGQVIGINSAKMSSNYSENSASVEGLGFAIPMTQAKSIIDDLINYNYVPGRPQLGIRATDIDEATSSLYNMPVGVFVRTVTPGGAADVANIEAGDIIIGINGEAISTSEELNKIKNQFKAGDVIKLTIYRNGKDIDIDVTLQEVTQGDAIFNDDNSIVDN